MSQQQHQTQRILLNLTSCCPDFRIEYRYYEAIATHIPMETLKHALPSELITPYLEQKSYILEREDIIHLLKKDGASFIEDSLRIYDPAKDSYLRVQQNWRYMVDKSKKDGWLSFWVIPVNIETHQKQEELAGNLKALTDKVFTQIKYLDNKIDTSIKTMRTQVNGLRTKMESHAKQKFEEEMTDLKTQISYLSYQMSKEKKLFVRPVLQVDQIEKALPENLELSPAQKTHIVESLRRISSDIDSGKIDIALMYAEPLLKKDELLGFVDIGDPVNFELECIKVLEILKAKGSRINVYFEVATIAHLVEVLSKSPTILHIMCHGSFNKTKNEFYLCFENENGELCELYAEDLRKIFDSVKFDTKLVFINACHSAAVAQVFVDAGVPCVIAVQSELKIEDKIARKFSEAFYWQLFEGKSIEEAVVNARATAITEEAVYTCCCAHMHKANCKWKEAARLKDAESAHYLHTPTCNCARKTKNKFKHGHNCMWALDFVLEYSNSDDIPENNICCCSPELSHNEILKFQMLCKDPENAKQEIFKYKKIGRVQVTSTYSQLKRRFPVQRISGRNMEMHQIYNQLKSENKRLVNLYGNSGIGKTTLAKLVSNYLLERGYFKDRICYIDLKDVVDRDYFNNSLFSQVPNADDFGTFHEALEEKSMLFILDNCDSFIKKSLPYLQHDLREILECNPNVKFLIITNKYSNVELGESHVEMGNLRKIDAAKLLCKNAYEYLEYHERDIYGLASHQILELVPLTPQGILSIVGKLQNESLTEITDTLLNNKQMQDNEFLQQKSQAETMKITLEDISKQHPAVYELLMLICQFPSGICYKDLEELAFRQKIPNDWKEILIDFLVTKKSSHKDSETTETPPTRASFQPDNYLWLTVSQDPLDNNEVWFEPSPFMVEYVQQHLYVETSQQKLLKLEYMVLLCTTILEKMKNTHFYIETLFECSAFSTYGIWKAQKGKPGALGEASSRLNYLQTAQFNSFIRLKKLFKRYEPTFLTCLEPQSLYNSEYLSQARDFVEALCLLVPTVFKLMAPEGYKAKEGITKAERVAERIEEILKVKDTRVLILRIKLNLFGIGMAVLDSLEKPKNHIFCQQKFKLMDQIKKEIRDSSVRKHVSAETAFANAYFIYQKYKEHIKDDNFVDYHQEVYNLLKKAKKLLVSFTGEEFKILKAKITLLQGIIEPNEGTYADWNLDKHLRSVKKAVLAFKTYGSLRLIMEAHFAYARVKLE